MVYSDLVQSLRIAITSTRKPHPMTANRILVVYAHRSPATSRVNRALVNAATALPNVTVHDLMANYGDFRIDVAREQRLLREHDAIVFQFPLHWYSTPAILKEWQDAVLSYGFAYGSGGDKLHGKKLMVATTSGGPAEAYQTSGSNHYTMGEMLRPLQATANLTGMAFQPIFTIHGVRMLDDAGLDRAARAYVERLNEL